MQKIKLIITLCSLCFSTLLFSQCEYTLDSYSHNDCFGGNTGTINITVLHPSASASWTGPNGFSSSSNDISNLYAGTYYLTITNVNQACVFLDSIGVEETIKISADFDLTGRCKNEDSVNVLTTLWGGTPPYISNWSNGQAGPDAVNLPPTSSSPHILTVTDINSCTDTIHLWSGVMHEMNSFMSSVGVICKDDYSGEARVFVEHGTPPYKFIWTSNLEMFIPQDDNFSIEPFSSISGLYPGLYTVQIEDDMGCLTTDSIEVKSNPNTCLTIYKAFSPNDDDIHEFWEIENIHLYPSAIISVYDRNGQEVFRRRNYRNAESEAFGGKDKNGQPLPSATYYYIIDLENGDNVFKGTLTIVR